MSRMLVAFDAMFAIGFAGLAYGGVRTTGLLVPTDVLKNAHVWLDAADETTFTTDSSGNVTEWATRSDSGNDATAYKLGSDQRYGTVGLTNGVPAYLMGPVGSRIDLKFALSTSLRTIFWAMDIESSPSAFFLGDGSTYMFHRDTTLTSGGYPYAYSDKWTGSLWCDGAAVADKFNVPVPTGLHVYTSAPTTDMRAQFLSNDRNMCSLNRNGGRALSELVLFNEPLEAYDRLRVEGYLRVKWMDATTTLSSVQTLGPFVYPNLTVDGDAAIAVPADPSPTDGCHPFVSVMGTLAKGTASKIRLTVPSAFYCGTTRTILVCGAASGVSGTGDFEVSGLGDGFTLAWTGTALVATRVLPSGAETKTLTADEVLTGPFAWTGTLDRGAAEKVRVTMPRTLAAYAAHETTVLSCGASANIGLGDFEVANLPVGAKLFWNGVRLTATYPRAREPEILSGDAHIWLDAADSDSFVWTDDRAGVKTWRDRSLAGHDALASPARDNFNVSATRYGTVGVTNGVTAYLMGETGSGIDLAFPYTRSLRTVFWAMDIALSGHAFFLGAANLKSAMGAAIGDAAAYDYHRGDDKHYARFNAFAEGDLRCDGVRVADPKNTYPPTGFHLYSHVAVSTNTANSLSNDRNNVNRSGGRALSELILFNRALEESERQAVEKYLTLKWWTTDAVTFADETACGAGTNVEASVQLDGDAVLKFDALPRDGVTGLAILGKLCRGTAGKVRFAFPEGTALDHPVELLTCATSIGVEKGDIEITGLSGDYFVYWDGKTLTLGGGSSVLEPTAILNRAHLWLDAAADDTFTTNETGGVTMWATRSDSGNDAKASKAKDAGGTLAIRYGTVGETNGVAAYLMGAVGSGIDLSFDRTTTLRTAFWAMDIANSSDAFFLGDTSGTDFHRGRSIPATYAGLEKSGISQSTIYCDGVDVGSPNSAVPPDGLHVYACVPTGNCSAARLSYDRSQSGRSGGRALSELVLFNEPLSAYERRIVENYLRVKWTGAPTAALATAVNAPSADSAFTSLDLAYGASFTLTNALAKGESAITVAGHLTKSAPGKIVIDANGQAVAPGAVLLQCASSEGVFLADFDLTSFGRLQRRIVWNGQTLMVRPKRGFAIFLR